MMTTEKHLTRKHLTKYFIWLYFGAFSLLLTGCSDTEKLQPLAPDAVILTFGDSLTYGTGTSRDKAYPAVLEKLIHHKVINAGIPGEVSEKGLQRLPGLIEQYQPSLIIICHGANDILRKLDIVQVKSNLQKMIDIAQKNNIEVVLIGVPEFSLWLNTSPIYAQLAENNHLPLEENILSDIIADNALKSDQMHPNAKGYQVLAESLEKLLIESGAIQQN